MKFVSVVRASEGGSAATTEGWLATLRIEYSGITATYRSKLEVVLTD